MFSTGSRQNQENLNECTPDTELMDKKKLYIEKLGRREN